MSTTYLHGTLALSHLEALPTVRSSQWDDLKIETPEVRVWLSRLSVADGAPYDHEVTVEWFRPSRGWVIW